MGMTLHAIEMDARTGGSYRLNYGGDMDFVGTYVEVTPYSRIVWTNDEGGDNGSVTTVTFTEDGDVLTHHSANELRHAHLLLGGA
jgi:uncharacterized protein YndB with AHSA1/START domain